MADIYIFVFGLTVTILVGAGLSAMIIANNRALAHDEGRASSNAVEPVPVTSRATESERR